MGSSNKSRKHYKKDSRFVADLYTFTYDDDLDCVRDTKNEGRQRIEMTVPVINYGNIIFNEITLQFSISLF